MHQDLCAAPRNILFTQAFHFPEQSTEFWSPIKLQKHQAAFPFPHH